MLCLRELYFRARTWLFSENDTDCKLQPGMLRPPLRHPLHVWQKTNPGSPMIGRLPYPEAVYTGWSSVHWNATGMLLFDPVYTGIPLGDPANTCRVHWNTTGKTYLKQPTLECHWRNSNFCSLHWNTTGGTVTAHTSPDTYSQACRVASMPVWNDKMAGHQ